MYNKIVNIIDRKERFMDLQQARLSKKLTQKELAELCNIKRSSVAMIETYKYKPSVKVAKKIAKVLDFDWTEFYEE